MFIERLFQSISRELLGSDLGFVPPGRFNVKLFDFNRTVTMFRFTANRTCVVAKGIIRTAPAWNSFSVVDHTDFLGDLIGKSCSNMTVIQIAQNL